MNLHDSGVGDQVTKDDRPPGFFLYVDDLTSDGKVEAMTTREFGSYILLLCKSWRENPPGSIPNDDRILARWSRLTPEEWSECRTSVLAAFTLGTEGRWHQKRLRKEYDKAVARKKQLSTNASLAASSRWKKRVCVTHAPSNADAMPESCLSSSSSNALIKPPPPIKHPTFNLDSSSPSKSDEPPIGGGGNLEVWTEENEARVRIALKETGLGTYNELIDECQQEEITPGKVLAIVAEYQLNMPKFTSPGAIVQKLRTDVWPVNGVQAARDFAVLRVAKGAKTRAEKMQILRFKLIKAGHQEARDQKIWDDATVIAKAMELGIIKK